MKAIAVTLVLVLIGLSTAARANGLSFTSAHAAVVRGPFPFVYTELPRFGDPTTFYGRVSAVGLPFSNIAPGGTYELTFYITATCRGMGNWDDFQCNTGGLLASYVSAILSVYLDPSLNSVETSPDTYRDGELVLRAHQTWLFFLLSAEPSAGCPADPTDIIAYFDFIGGSWFQSVTNSGQDVECELVGELTGMQNLPLVGTVLNFDGSIRADHPVAVHPTTWGRVKSLYR